MAKFEQYTKSSQQLEELVKELAGNFEIIDKVTLDKYMGISIKYWYLVEHMEQGIVTVLLVKSENQVADILTKPLSVA